MPPAHRLGDIGSGHGCHFPPTPAIVGSPNVFVNGMPAMRVGDAYLPHPCPACPIPPHPRALAQGSPSVFVNSIPAGRVGDAIGCGGSAATGSPNVVLDEQGISSPALRPMRPPLREDCAARRAVE